MAEDPRDHRLNCLCQPGGARRAVGASPPKALREQAPSSSGASVSAPAYSWPAQEGGHDTNVIIAHPSSALS